MNARVILVTGSNGGLGRAIARAFLEENDANFVWLGIHIGCENAGRLEAEFPARSRLLTLDVTQPEVWKRAVQTILDHSRRIDVLVNNAGKHEDSLLASMSSQSWSSVLAGNLDAVFHGCQAVLPAMIAQRGGRIINIASLSALLVPPGQANYAAAKAGVLALSQSLAKEIARIGITVNSVCPGYVETEALSGMGEEERKAALLRVPMRRFARPEEVAAAVRFLASAEASYITGSTLKVDGGIF